MHTSTQQSTDSEQGTRSEGSVRDDDIGHTGQFAVIVLCSCS